ncbi:MAG: aminoacyl-histidine dipeptidase [Victivallaceae bacterium]|jgi:dipeptidase D
MSDELKKLSPGLLWNTFSDICSIPHPSGHEASLRDFLKSRAEDAGLKTVVDKAGNMLIEKPAFHGMENRRTVILQSHLDMVPQKNSDIKFDFIKDPVKPYIDGDVVKAKDTTLGADNGIGVAAMMALLLDKDIQHGPLKAVFTVEEETGLNGANKLSPHFIEGDILINLDSEEEHRVFVGCAGGVRSNHEFIIEYDAVPPRNTAMNIRVSGLKGGHSGCDINSGRANSLKLLAEMLTAAEERFGLKLADLHGGNLDNAIPREAFATVLMPVSDTDQFADFAAGFEVEKVQLFGRSEPGLHIQLICVRIPDRIFEAGFQKRLLLALNACPNGVIAMSEAFPGVVETSTNLAAVKNEHGKIIVRTSQRSSSADSKKRLADKICDIFTSAGAVCTRDCDYPGWEPRRDSAILKTFSEVHKDVSGKEPEVVIIHAGLECGIIHSINPGLDMISFGPEIRNAHSPDECVSIPSVARFWNLLLKLLKAV